MFKIQIGPMVITYTQIFTSIASSIIIFPVSFVVVKIFSNVDSRYRPWRETIQASGLPVFLHFVILSLLHIHIPVLKTAHL